MILHEKQREAIKTAFANRVSVVCGGPGTGKSLTISVLVSIYRKVCPTRPILLCAPTGRAAKRMNELSGHEAKTIHRLLGYNPEIGFVFNEDEPLPTGLLIVDEVSMMDILLARALFAAIPDTMQVVLVGDADQLPSVGPGSVLRDIIDSGAVPVTRLEYIYRQEEGSGISSLAACINKGDMPDIEHNHADVFQDLIQTPDEAMPLAVKWAKYAYEHYGLLGFTVLSPGHRGSAGVKALNEAIREALNPGAKGSKFAPGDRVMVVKNNYQHDVFNGDLGVVRSVDDEGGSVDVDFGDKWVTFGDGEEFAPLDLLHLAFASTIHKCVAPGTLIETERGLIRIGEAERGQVASLDGSKAFRRTPDQPPQEMLRITTKDGYSVTVTPEHGLDSWDGQTYRRIQASDLKVGDWLQIGLGSRIEPSDPMLPVPTNGDVRERPCSIPSSMTDDLAEFFGLMVSDGTVYKRGFRFAKGYEEVTDRFAALCFSLFGIEPKRYVARNAYFAEVNSGYLSRWLTQIGGMESRRKAIPQCVLSGCSQRHRSFLRGVFEDATVNVRTHGGVEAADHIEFCTSQEQLARDVHVMLARLGIVSSRVQRCRGPHQHNKIYVYGRNAALFARDIGFIAEKKRNRCVFAAKTEKNYTMPVSRDEPKELRQICGDVFTAQDKNNAQARGRISRAKAQAVLATGNAPDWLVERASNHHDRITAIEKVAGPSTCLYVPDGNRFLQNAISGWNSQGGEYPVCIVVLTRQHYIMLARNLLYTAVTRAKKTLVIIHQEGCLKQAVRNNRIAARNSRLAERLRGDQ